MDIDSEGENDPKWLQTKTMMMIDDFTDVNEGEKELMKMWNLHVMKYGYVGDCQIPLACQMFLEKKGKELLMKNLYRNFVLHMCSLFDFGLISPVILYQMIQKLQEIMKEGGENGDVRKILQKSHEAQVERWITTGVYAPADSAKSNNSCAKINFNNEGSHSNARRKTTLPLGSPPNSQGAKSSTSVHNNATKHASMMGASSNKSLSLTNAIQNSLNKNGASFTTQNGVSKNASSNSSRTSSSASSNSHQNENAQKSDPPTRRKSTNSVQSDSSVPMRRKSMASDNSCNEFHRRKLILDAIHSG